MKIKTSELQGAALDWAVAKCEKMDIEIRPAGTCGRPLYVLAAKEGYTPWTWEPSTNWSYAGPIIEREKLTVAPSDQKSYVEQEAWTSYRIKTLFTDQGDIDYQTGPTPLIAAMRCYVASKLGDEVEIPEELK
jgi:hypothetical protein